MVDGKRHVFNLETGDLSEAIRRRREIDTAPLPSQKAGAFVSEIEAFIRHKVAIHEKTQTRKGYTPASVESKQAVLNLFAREIKAATPASVTVAHLNAWYKKTAARVAASTADGYMNTIRSFYNWLEKSGKVSRNPVLGVELHGYVDRGRSETVIDAETTKRIIDECPRDDLKFCLCCGLLAGMRKAEVIEARPEWFIIHGGHEGRGYIHVKATDTFLPKDKEARQIPLASEFKEFLLGYGLPAPFMLHPARQHGKNRYRYDFRLPYNEYMKDQGLEGVGFHQLRHSFASRLAMNGLPLIKVARYLGDDVRVVEKYYTHLQADDDLSLNL